MDLSRGSRPERAALVLEQPALARQAAAVTAELAVRVDDAMARNDDRELVRTVRGADGAHGSRAADGARELRIAPRLAGRDRQQRVPDGVLKRRARARERRLER